MKKSEALKKVPVEYLGRVKNLERLGLYYMTYKTFGGDSKAIPVMLTHFYEHGLKLKVLVKNQMMSHNGLYHIRYDRLDRFTLKPMPAEDLPLFAGDANENMSTAFLRSKAFKNT